MAKVRDILIDVKIEQAQRQRKCRRNSSHVIAKGEWCLVVRTNATNDDYSYSREAAKPMLDAAWAKLQAIYHESGGGKIGHGSGGIIRPRWAA